MEQFALHDFVTRWEKLETEKQEIARLQADIMIDAKARGFDPTTIRACIKARTGKTVVFADAEKKQLFYLYMQTLEKAPEQIKQALLEKHGRA